VQHAPATEDTVSTGSNKAAGPRGCGVLRGQIAAVVTAYNEEKNVHDLLDSLKAQQEPFEVVAVDAGSTDGTWRILQEYAETWDGLDAVQQPGTRGACRNLAVERTDADVVAFIDGDCIANPFWAENLREAWDGHDIIAGRTIDIGYWAFENLQRVELEHQGIDVTFPSCNLAYDREAFEAIGGFDDRFETAEDIDLNYRAVEAGSTIGYNEDAVVYHRARDSFTAFFQQAFWNGYGRKQLTLKHGNLWEQYSFRRMLDTQIHVWGLARLGVAALGYLTAYARERGWEKA
jgi:glycosyltransferase involved in cell wall biosynthesis